MATSEETPLLSCRSEDKPLPLATFEIPTLVLSFRSLEAGNTESRLSRGVERPKLCFLDC